MTCTSPTEPQYSTASSIAASVVLCLLVVFALGCEDGRPRTYPVSGTVRFSDDSLVRTGYVELIPIAGGPSARGKINRTGHFGVGTYGAADGAPAGDYIALVLQHERPIGPEQARKLGPEHAVHAHASHLVSLKYSSRETSDLVCTVRDSEDNQLTFTVEARRPPQGRPPKKIN